MKTINFDENTGELNVSYTNFDDTIGNTNLIQVNIEPENFLKIRETLERIGIYASKEKILWQSAHILHKKGFYYIVHFKQLFALDGRKVEFTEDDLIRLKVIIALLNKWNLVKVIDENLSNELKELTKDDNILPVRLKIIPFSRRRDYNLKSKYTIGKNIEKEETDTTDLLETTGS